MLDNKQLSTEQLDKVTGDCKIGDCRIVECEACKKQFDPDTTLRGPDDITSLENGEYGYVTYLCPYCNEYHRVKFIQIKPEDLKMDGFIYFGN